MTISLIKSIPVIFTGMLLFFTASAQDLALELFREGRWDQCQRECKRIEIDNPKDTSPRVRLLSISCSIKKADVDAGRLISLLSPLVSQKEDLETSPIASFEMAKLLRNQEADEAALDAFAHSFHSTTNRSLFLQSACSAFLLMEKHPSLKAGRTPLIQQINSSRSLWTGRLFSICRHKHESSWFTPADWFVGFYRNQISPAIGQRCTLEPSCSEYFHQAAARHNTLLAVPLVADRFVREPGVNNEKNNPVYINGMIRYRDPLDEHDFWMKK